MSAAPPPYPGGPGKAGEAGYPPPGGPPPAGQPYGPPPGAQPGYPQQGQTTVVVAQPAVTVIQQFRESPVHTKCPHCSAEIVTATMYETGTFTWIICLVLCLVGCDLGCCLIPFCVDGCKDVCHTCPNCHQQIARWNRL
ncbi:hypothetical protein ScPMuIL_004454 [Solemya velum]